MKLFKSIAALVLLLGLTACNIPDKQLLAKGKFPSDTRIDYELYQYETPYAIQGIQATHLLTVDIVKVSQSSDTRYFGIPESVDGDIRTVIEKACGDIGRQYWSVKSNGRVEVKKADLYIGCY